MSIYTLASSCTKHYLGRSTADWLYMNYILFRRYTRDQPTRAFGNKTCSSKAIMIIGTETYPSHNCCVPLSPPSPFLKNSHTVQHSQCLHNNSLGQLDPSPPRKYTKGEMSSNLSSTKCCSMPPHWSVGTVVSKTLMWYSVGQVISCVTNTLHHCTPWSVQANFNSSLAGVARHFPCARKPQQSKQKREREREREREYHKPTDITN